MTILMSVSVVAGGGCDNNYVGFSCGRVVADNNYVGFSCGWWSCQ